MNMFEEAQALFGMINMCSLTQSEIAKKMGVSQSYVANKIRLLNFSEGIRKLILDAHLTERHARALLKIKSEETTKLAIEKIKSMNLCVSASEALVENMILSDMPKSISATDARNGIERFEEILSESIKNLSVCGVNVKKKTDYCGNKRYITLCIEE